MLVSRPPPLCRWISQTSGQNAVTNGNGDYPSAITYSSVPQQDTPPDYFSFYSRRNGELGLQLSDRGNYNARCASNSQWSQGSNWQQCASPRLSRPHPRPSCAALSSPCIMPNRSFALFFPPSTPFFSWAMTVIAAGPKSGGTDEVGTITVYVNGVATCTGNMYAGDYRDVARPYGYVGLHADW